ncbi:MAG: transglutaminase domain-containing protein [Cyanobacteria bacterium P01_A01_bin.123]
MAKTASNRLIRPIGAYALQGIAFQENRLLGLDLIRGYLLDIDPASDDATIVNHSHIDHYVDATGLALWEDTVWITRNQEILRCPLQNPLPTPFSQLPYTADGVAVWQSTIYVTCQKAGAILVFNSDTGRRITKFPAPGIGVENITVWGDYLWVCDQTEQTVYCLDRATGEVLMSALTPFASPTGIAVLPETTPTVGTVWLAYANEEPYIRDNPNAVDPFELTFRDRTFIAPLHFRYHADAGYVLSNRYRIEMAYVEEISPLDAIQLHNVEWRMALPADTDRQTLTYVEPVGVPFREEQVNGRRTVVFHFDELNPHESHLLGWKAQIEVGGIKYQLSPRQVEGVSPLSADYQQRYLIDDDELAMDNPTIQAAAKVAVGRETNLLRKVLSIRNYVYDRLSYGIRPHIDTPDVVLERGIGSCGEYVGLLLALCRLNGIACRTVGRYKCPPHADHIGLLLEPDFNHVWIEFFVPGYGWLPMESNVDDVVEGGPYPTRFFMGLPWYHVEMGKEVTFEKVQTAEGDPEVKLGELAINHVRFKILEALPLDALQP